MLGNGVGRSIFSKSKIYSIYGAKNQRKKEVSSNFLCPSSEKLHILLGKDGLLHSSVN